MATDRMMTTSTTAVEEEEEAEEAVTTSTSPVNWKLYDNPFYQNPSSQSHFHKHLVRKYSASAKHIHRIQRDLKLGCPSAKISSELDQARAQIAQLKEELELERKLRKKAESLNKMMARELVDQRREREKMSDDLNKEMSAVKAELEKQKKEIDQERKMLKMAEVLREERLQMKLSDAKLFYQEKFQKLTQKTPTNPKPQKKKPSSQKTCTASSSCCSTSSSSSSSNSTSIAAGGSKRSSMVNVHATQSSQRKASPEPENPHIKRGIKGFVEFPRFVKAVNGSTTCHSSRDMGTKLECQKAQLKILMKQKSSVSANNLVIS